MALTPEKKKVQFSFVSEGNDLAEIELVLYNNNQFVLLFKDLERQHQNRWKGRWKKTDKSYTLTFSSFRNPDLEILFPKREGDTDIIVQDKNKVTIREFVKGIWIWGIYCKRSE